MNTSSSGVPIRAENSPASDGQQAEQPGDQDDVVNGAHGQLRAAAISATMAAAAAAGSAAAVIGRPTTSASAPARIAAAGVITRFWSPDRAPAGRMPGVTRRRSAAGARARRREFGGRQDQAVHAAGARPVRRGARPSRDAAA